MKKPNFIIVYIIPLVWAILISGPVSFIIASIVEVLFFDSDKDIYTRIIAAFVAYIPILYAIYVLLGIPVTLIIDLLTKVVRVQKTIYIYIIQVILFFIVTSILARGKLEGYFVFGIPVFTYFHILFYFRVKKSYRTKVGIIR